MSYRLAAEAAEAFADTLRRVDAETRDLRIADAFASFARALEPQASEEAARAAVAAAAEQTRSDRLSAAALGDLADHALALRELGDAFGAKKAVSAALGGLADIATAHAAADAHVVLAGLRAAAEIEAAKSAEADEKRREKDKADRRLGALYAEKLAAAAAARAPGATASGALGAVMDEMKKRKPALAPAAWREAANLWVGVDDERSGKAARQAIESKCALLRDRSSGVDKPRAVAV